MESAEMVKLDQRRQESNAQWQEKARADLYISIGMGTCGLAAGSADTLAAVEAELQRRGLKATINRVGCVGMCSFEPMVEIQAPGRPRISYGKATANNVSEILAAYLDGSPLHEGVALGQVDETVVRRDGQSLRSLSFLDPESKEKIAFHRKQLRIVLSNCGMINPESIDDYLAMDGYKGLEIVLGGMSPEQVIEQIKRSGLRGRGGGGFNAGVKWSLARQTERWPKHVICNADEGDPGAFMDRSVLEGDPHSLIEGMTIAGYAIGAAYGYIYCRAEYPLAIRRLKIALNDARSMGLLGENILGSGFSFDIEIKEGAGAFVCGEETALMASIMGERGQPWPRPPYPAVAGLWGQPSNVNNVKTYAYTPRVIRDGSRLVQGSGHGEQSRDRGFCAEWNGKPHRSYRSAHGNHAAVKSSMTLGAASRRAGNSRLCRPAARWAAVCRRSIWTFRSILTRLRAAGAVMGSGGMIVADETTCMVEFSKYFMKFVVD